MTYRHTILLVDDEEHVLRSLSRLLRREGYNILTANNALDGLVILRDNAVNLVVSDQEMPGLGGIEFLKTIKVRYPEIIRIILTGQGDTLTAISAINEGEVYRFLTKPWDGDELKITIRQALEHHDLLQEVRILVNGIKEQSSLLNRLEREHPGITKSPERLGDAYYISEDDLSMSLEGLMKKYFPDEEGLNA